MTATTNKQILRPFYTQYSGDATGWTSPINGNWDIIDSAFGGTHTVSLSSSNVTLTDVQCQNVRIKLTGTTAAANLTVFFPVGISGLFVVDNTTTGTGTITLASAGAGLYSVVAVRAANTLIWLDASTDSVYLADNSPVTGGVGISVTGASIDLDVPVTVPNGGTGQTTYLPGQLLIGNNAGGLTPATLTPGSNISITNGNGAITIAASGTVAGVNTFSAGSTGLTPNTGSAGTVVLGGTLNVSSGGTGASTLTGYVKGTGTTAMTASATVPGTDLSGAYTTAGLTMATNRLLGRASGSIGAAEEIAIGSGLSLSGGTLSSSATGTVTSVSASSSAGGFGLSSTGGTTPAISFSVSSASTARSTLGLGSIATQDASAVAITGGTITVPKVTASAGAGLGFIVSNAGVSYASGFGNLNMEANTSFYGNTSTCFHSCNSITVWSSAITSSPTGTFTIGPTITPYTTNNWVVTSDASIKKDITDYSVGLAALKSLRTVSYKFNGMFGTQDDDKIHVGLIAQEVQQTPMSSIVRPFRYSNPKTGESADLLGLENSQLIFTLINAVKELDARLKALEAK